MAEFKTIAIRPTTGVFDTLSSADEIGFGNWRVVKNSVTRATRNRQRGGGWRRLFADDYPYNNQDLHDQLTDRQGYYDSYSDTAMGGGDLIGYSSAYYFGAYSTSGTQQFPPASGPFYPVYLGDEDGFYGNCPIFYPFVGYPYAYYVNQVSTTGLIAHWKMDTDSGGAAIPDEVGTHDLTIFGGSFVTGKIGNAFDISPTENLLNADGDFRTGDITFGFLGWIRPHSPGGADEHVCGRWNAGGREYRLIITGGALRFDVSNDGTAIVSVTHPHVLLTDTWTFFACWHDPTLNTINIKVNLEAPASTSHATGVYNGGPTAIYFSIGYDETSSTSTLDAEIDSLSFFKGTFPGAGDLIAFYNSGRGLDYPFVNSAPNMGAPWYYIQSYVYASCPVTYGAGLYPGYPYGQMTSLYEPFFSYDYEYCGTDLHLRPGCKEAITMLQEIVVSSGRKLIASTMSRLYELNQSSGTWRLLADGLGNSGYTTDQCTCNDVRGMSSTMGGYLIYTNNFDAPGVYFLGDSSQSGCDLQALEPIADLIALDITQAGGVIAWNGFVIFYDITENGERKTGKVIWSDLDDPFSFIEGDGSFAGSATVAVGATILNAAPLGNALMLYTDKSIIRVTLVGGTDVFNFETIYQGGNAMKYKFSLINAGDQHLYLGESDVYVLTQFDSRPINIPYITKAAGMIFNGITEDHATYDPINQEACNIVTGGWSDETREAFLSWPTGDAVCPNVTLRFNLKFGTADFIDHGFTAFLTFRKDDRPTFGQWLEDLGACPRGTAVDEGFKDGDACTGVAEVENPPLWIFNETENPDLPNDPRSLCALLSGKTAEDYCIDCAAISTFIAASADDFALKQLEDDVLYREMLGGNIEAYGAYACLGQFYHHLGYETVMQQGAENYRNDNEKMIKMIAIEAEPWPQSTPSILTAEVGYASTSSCFTWKPTKDLEFECQTERSAAQHVANNSRPDGTFYFPTWRRGRYLSARFIIEGIGGGGKFSAVNISLKHWGQPDNP